jgi:hypothetical protein
MQCNHQQRHGTLEPIRGGKFRLYCRLRGYVSRTGGYTSKAHRAQRFNGAGEAIRYAAMLGFAIVRWY